MDLKERMEQLYKAVQAYAYWSEEARRLARELWQEFLAHPDMDMELLAQLKVISDKMVQVATAERQADAAAVARQQTGE
jgi:hypothetical protein